MSCFYKSLQSQQALTVPLDWSLKNTQHWLGQSNSIKQWDTKLLSGKLLTRIWFDNFLILKITCKKDIPLTKVSSKHKIFLVRTKQTKTRSVSVVFRKTKNKKNLSLFRFVSVFRTYIEKNPSKQNCFEANQNNPRFSGKYRNMLSIKLFRLFFCLFWSNRNTEILCFGIEAKQLKQMFCFGLCLSQFRFQFLLFQIETSFDGQPIPSVLQYISYKPTAQGQIYCTGEKFQYVTYRSSCTTINCIFYVF